jgi:hypothetical protein
MSKIRRIKKILTAKQLPHHGMLAKIKRNARLHATRRKQHGR